MTNTAAIATKLNILETAIVRIEEWASVMFVVVKGLGGRFVSKKVAEVKMETRIERAEKIVKFLGFGKVWIGGNNVRVYFSNKSGFISIDKKNVSCQKMNHALAYMEIRDAGLLEVTSDLVDSTSSCTPVVSSRRTTCLNCDITTHIIMGRGYCTDCYGECN